MRSIITTIVRRILILCVVVLINIFFLSVEYTSDISAEMNIVMRADEDRDIQMFASETGEFVETQSQTIKYSADDKDGIVFDVPDVTKYIRIDFGSSLGEIAIDKFEIRYKSEVIDFLTKYKNTLLVHNMAECNYDESGMKMSCTGNDPFLVYDITAVELDKLLIEYAESNNVKRKFALCIVFDLICIICYLQRRKVLCFLKEIIGNKGLLLDLAKNDFKTKYAGSYLGIVWAFVQPIVTILVYWFVFQVGFRSGTIDDTPFVLWLTAGLVPWFFFNEALNSATASLLDYSYLVKKVVFNVGIIPPVRIVSALFVHIFFCVFMLILFMVNGIYPCLEWLQLLYYSACLVLLIMGITYLTSALVVFFRDLAQIIMVVLQVGMWVTPIMWNKQMVSGNLELIFKLNPLYYIVQGYRDSVIYHKWFWESEYETIFFWIFTLICLIAGNRIFNRLKIHFADVI